jgi:hypothetical protein
MLSHAACFRAEAKKSGDIFPNLEILFFHLKATWWKKFFLGGDFALERRFFPQGENKQHLRCH